MACIDIYQALTESRPYKSGMTHEAACEILENMVQKGWIDGEITEQIKKCFALRGSGIEPAPLCFTAGAARVQFFVLVIKPCGLKLPHGFFEQILICISFI